MNDAEGDPVAEAAARLEAAVDRLSRAMANRPAPALAGQADGADREAVAALAVRLDETIARLRGVLGEDA